MKLLKEKGFATLEMIVVGMMVLAGVGYVVSSRINLKKIEVAFNSRQHFEIVKRELTEALSLTQTCVASLGREGALNELTTFTGIFSHDGSEMYGVDKLLFGKILKKIDIEGYKPVLTGPSTQSVNLRVLVDTPVPGRVIGATSLIQKIPITLTTFNNIVVTCRADVSAVINQAQLHACEKLGGKFELETRRCRGLYGSQSPYVKKIGESLCKGETCRHPFSGKMCSGADVNGISWDNWVITGIDDDANLSCACVPIICQDPASVCEGIAIGTDHCFRNCGTGTKKDGVCGGKCDQEAWAPFVDPSQICKGRSMYQKNGCNLLRVVKGEKSC